MKIIHEKGRRTSRLFDGFPQKGDGLVDAWYQARTSLFGHVVHLSARRKKLAAFQDARHAAATAEIYRRIRHRDVIGLTHAFGGAGRTPLNDASRPTRAKRPATFGGVRVEQRPRGRPESPAGNTL
ncbi:hypothetical protein NJB1907Z4_P0830 (plasmid) [Mycobacterium pseudoshottsii]|uniref:Uncharacterized protein n=1 Tax=Mycobacterium pseudoshottsii TaxID=265949 RepID=A0A9N7LWM1_9MYCO|nr:hypothetical protein NJB1907Z4_P0830 [Mycobacterium pseudoshottsii]